MLVNGKKRVYFFLLFLPLLLLGNFTQNIIISKAIQLKLYNSYTWKALLHIHSNQSSINNSTFLLSYPNFNAKKELIYTLKAFFNTKKAILTYLIIIEMLSRIAHLVRQILYDI